MPRVGVTTVPRARAVQAASSHSSSVGAASSAHALQDSPDPPQPKLLRSMHTRKAERDERSDITRCLTPTKTYASGFTRPDIFRSAQWSSGGTYSEHGKWYDHPDPRAYKPRTVYVLEGRHPTVYGPGRVDCYPRITGVCQEPSFPHLVEMANSTKATKDFLEGMDSARWPWTKPRPKKPVKWWEEGEDPRGLRSQALTAAVPPEETTASSLPESTRAGLAPKQLLASGASSIRAVQPRHFHTSCVASSPDDPNSSEKRKHIPASTWSRPPRPSQDAKDDVVPTYYVERKKQRDHISQRKEEEGGLMAELNAGILSEGLAAKTRIREEKIPVEVRLPDGSIAHPSGFQPPTPETEFHPVAAKVPTVDDPLVATVKQTWDERDFPVAGADPITPDPEKEQEWLKRLASSGGSVLTGVRDINAEKPSSSKSAEPTSASDRSKIATSAWDSPSQSQENDPESVVPSYYIERKKQRDHIAERKEEEGGLMAELNAGILSEDLAAQTREREEKIPVEVPLKDGTIAHPSGFVPPTPETEFHPVAAKPPDSPKLPWTEVAAVKQGAPGTSEAGSAKKPGNARSFHTSAASRAAVLSDFSAPLERLARRDSVTSLLARGGCQSATAEIRKRYAPTLEKTPFWRPLVTVTVATRPIADTLERLSRGHARGTPFQATIDSDDRKNFYTYNGRLRNMQLERIRELTHQLAIRLGGAYGGMIGLRCNALQRGRGVNGELLAEPLPKEMRKIKIGVAEWYPFADEVKERFLDDAQRGGYSEHIEVFGLDEWGNRTDGKAWAGERPEKGTDMSVLMEAEHDELDVD
ncbi:hypothetical protein BV20DRAFT_971789 [Pilatotrama ljubarskyi]|nr:hypothetical protein BV20DRAFT_971789 [Pilatotrama ljubarskyi]